MSHIFVSYRRSDSNWATDRLITSLRDRFGHPAVFHDNDNIEPGRDFREAITQSLSGCCVLLVVIGEHWIDVEDERGKKRLDNPDDWVRIEVESGLSRQEVVVIPVVLRPARMPTADQLPTSLSELAYRQELAIFPGGDFEVGFAKLTAAIDKALRSRGIETHRAIDRKKRGGWAGLRSHPLLAGVIIALTVVAIIVGTVVALTRQITSGQRVHIGQGASADERDLEQLARRYRDHPVAPDRETQIEEREVEALGQPDYSNFEFRFDERIWLLHDYRPELVTPDSVYQSAMVMERTVLLVKTAPVKQIRFQARTMGRDLVFSPKAGCPPSHVEMDGGTIKTGVYRTLSKHLCFDVSKIDINEPFSIAFRTSYWDAPGEASRWIGATSYPGCLRLRVVGIGPASGAFEKFERKKCDSFESPVEPCLDGLAIVAGDRGAFLWSISNPDPSKIYMFFF